VNLSFRVENSRADAVLVQRSISQRIELGARPPASPETAGTETVGDERDEIDGKPGEPFFQPLFAGGGFDGTGQLFKRDDMSADEPSRYKRA